MDDALEEMEEAHQLAKEKRILTEDIILIRRLREEGGTDHFRDVTKMLPRHPGHQNRKREA